MAEKKEQVKPLAPLPYRTSSDEDEALYMHSKHHSRKRFILCCGCVAALLLILVVVILVLIFTVFQIDDPRIRMNAVTIQGLEIEDGTLRTDANATLLTDVSVKNPNVASFRFTNTTSKIYYGGELVGEARQHIQGVARARRTLRRNVTVDIIPRKILEVPSLKTDLISKALNISCSTRIAGKVKILGIFKKNVVGRLNCTMNYNFSRSGFQGLKCGPI